MNKQKPRFITYTDRLVIEEMLKAGCTKSAVAKKLGCTRATITRETQRVPEPYDALEAQKTLNLSKSERR